MPVLAGWHSSSPPRPTWHRSIHNALLCSRSLTGSAKATFLDSEITAQKCTIAVLVGTGVLRRFLQHRSLPQLRAALPPLQLTQTRADEGDTLATKRRSWYGRRRAISPVCEARPGGTSDAPSPVRCVLPNSGSVPPRSQSLPGDRYPPSRSPGSLRGGERTCMGERT